MKILHLIKTKLQAIIRQNTLVFVFLCIGLFACDLMFIYIFGVYRNFSNSSNIPDYYIEYATGSLLNAEEISSEILSVVSVENMEFYTQIDSDNSMYGAIKIDGDQFLLRASTNIDGFVVSRGDLNGLQKTGTVLIPESIYDNVSGDSITLNGVSLEIVGTIAADNYFLISADTMKELGFSVLAAAIYRGDNGRIKDKMQEEFEKNYVVSYIENTALKEDSRNNLYFILLLYMICAVTFLFFCTYLYEDSSYEFNIYEILGATKLHIIAILMGAIITILTMVYWVAVGVHYSLYGIFFIHLLSESYTYTICDYITVYLLSVSVITLFLSVWLLIKTRNSMITNSRKMIR